MPVTTQTTTEYDDCDSSLHLILTDICATKLEAVRNDAAEINRQILSFCKGPSNAELVKRNTACKPLQDWVDLLCECLTLPNFGSAVASMAIEQNKWNQALYELAPHEKLFRSFLKEFQGTSDLTSLDFKFPDWLEPFRSVQAEDRLRSLLKGLPDKWMDAKSHLLKLKYFSREYVTPRSRDIDFQTDVTGYTADAGGIGGGNDLMEELISRSGAFNVTFNDDGLIDKATYTLPSSNVEHGIPVRTYDVLAEAETLLGMPSILETEKFAISCFRDAALRLAAESYRETTVSFMASGSIEHPGGGSLDPTILDE